MAKNQIETNVAAIRQQKHFYMKGKHNIYPVTYCISHYKLKSIANGGV